MKKWISTLLTVSLVVSMAAVLHACGKPKTEDQTTQQASAVPAGESVTAIYEDKTDSALDEYMSELFNLERESYTVTEVTTDEHYQEDYDKLTLPHAVTTQPVAGTTRPQSTTNPAVRSTTEQFQFTYSPQTTRAPIGSSSTTKASASTANSSASTVSSSASTTVQNQQTDVSDTTVMQEVISDSHVGYNGRGQAVSGVTRPQVTYMDRYVKKILDGGVYTLEAEIKGEGVSLPYTTYTNGTDIAQEMSITNLLAQEADLPLGLSKIGKVRTVVKNANSSNPKAYLVIPALGGYVDLGEDSDIQEEFGSMQGMGADSYLEDMLMLDRLEYYGMTSGVGYVCETYLIPGEDAAISFYFTDTGSYQGVVKCEMIDTQTNQVVMTMEMRLYDRVTNKNAFNVSGKKISLSELKGKLG